MNDLSATSTVVEFSNLSLCYGKTLALDEITLAIPAGKRIGLIGPDGVGKSTLLSLISGVHALQQGQLKVLGGDMRSAVHRNRICPRIAYMPQGLGKNLYLSLTVEENLQFFARIFGQNEKERRRRIDRLTQCTGLYPFLNRPAEKLSGGMKQKLGLCCALIHEPELLILDEPTTGVDPLSRRQFWDLIDDIKQGQPDLSVIVATAYMDEARRFDWLIAMDAGHILDAGTPQELLDKTHCRDIDSAFIQLLPEATRAGHREVVVPPLTSQNDFAIEAVNLSKCFGDFTAVDQVSFKIRRGEIFGFLGSNGCGKTTTMRMLTGLLPPTKGFAKFFGRPLDGKDLSLRQKFGYMPQLFSLYNELNVRQNLELRAKLYDLPHDQIPHRVNFMMAQFQLLDYAEMLPTALPVGIKQRLSLAAAVIHRPQILILDEPTSGVDPVARDRFWELLVALSRREKVTIFISTHFMNEAERCDRVVLMHAGRSLACDTPENLVRANGSESLEDAFIGCLEKADDSISGDSRALRTKVVHRDAPPKSWFQRNIFDFDRFCACCWLEIAELLRDRIRMAFMVLGAMILLVVNGYGISTDVEQLDFAIFDHDQSLASAEYCAGFLNSRYFTAHQPVSDYEELDRRLKSGELKMVVELPPAFGQNLHQGRTPQVGYWVDGSKPSTAETVANYIATYHSTWQQQYNRGIPAQSNDVNVDLEARYRYNPDVLSLPALLPAVIPLLLLMFPAVLAALSIVREKETGSITNMFITPIRRSEFLFGKQLPYVFLSLVCSIVLILLTVFLFKVPLKGGIMVLLFAFFFYGIASTGMGILCAMTTKSQITVIFLTLVVTVMPSMQLCGMSNPVADDISVGALIGNIFPMTYMLIISRGVFNKGLFLWDLWQPFGILVAEGVILGIINVLLLRKQEK